MLKKLLLSAVVIAALAPVAVSAKDISKSLKSMATINILPWIHEPMILEALKASNAKTKDYDQGTIDAMDTAWREAVKTGADDSLVNSVVQGPVSEFFRKKYKSSGGTIVEVILMDARGLNVAATRAPSDYWQGDEPKFQNSFGAGPSGVDTGEVEYDASTNTYAAQISYPIDDPATGELIGAITVGLSTSGLD